MKYIDEVNEKIFVLQDLIYKDVEINKYGKWRYAIYINDKMFNVYKDTKDVLNALNVIIDYERFSQRI